MSNNALFTIEQVDNKLIITVEAVKVETVEPEKVDFSKYKPFPEGYIPTKEIKAIRVSDPDNHIKIGTIGIIHPDKSDFPHFYYGQERDEPQYSTIHYLAPLDPSDHPDYKPEQPEARPMNADEIEDWVNRCLESNLMPNNLSYFINEAIQYELNKAKR